MDVKWIKVILSMLLLACLFSWPYGYYELVRFTAFVGFGYLAFQEHKQVGGSKVFVYGALALLFQPFFKIALGRTLWNVVDVGVAVFLIIDLLKASSSAKKT